MRPQDIVLWEIRPNKSTQTLKRRRITNNETNEHSQRFPGEKSVIAAAAADRKNTVVLPWQKLFGSVLFGSGPAAAGCGPAGAATCLRWRRPRRPGGLEIARGRGGRQQRFVYSCNNLFSVCLNFGNGSKRSQVCGDGIKSWRWQMRSCIFRKYKFVSNVKKSTSYNSSFS